MKLKDILNEKKQREVDIAPAVAKHLEKLTIGLKAYQKVTTDKGWKKGIDQILAQIEKTQAIADKEGSTRGVLPY
jgi:hypothetical protein|tara:strand:+ start:66 stop:290 length:225 start_codon:yes stop_codon:yes gene_type:complete